MTVREVIDAIIQSTGPLPYDRTCDELIEGSFDAEVKGIATTFTATVDVIRKAAKLGCNLIITHEPTYYSGPNEHGWETIDPVHREKKKLIGDLGISIFRLHDHMHLKNDTIYYGLIKELGWESYRLPDYERPHAYVIPETTLGDLAYFFKEKLEMDTVRIVGDPETKCSRIGVLVGGGSLGLGRPEMPIEEMRNLNLDVTVCGDILEFGFLSYARDAAMLGHGKGLLIIGHERTEEPGMKYMPDWLQPLVPGMKVVFIDSKEPFTYL